MKDSALIERVILSDDPDEIYRLDNRLHLSEESIDALIDLGSKQVRNFLAHKTDLSIDQYLKLSLDSEALIREVIAANKSSVITDEVRENLMGAGDAGVLFNLMINPNTSSSFIYRIFLINRNWLAVQNLLIRAFETGRTEEDRELSVKAIVIGLEGRLIGPDYIMNNIPEKDGEFMSSLLTSLGFECRTDIPTEWLSKLLKLSLDEKVGVCG